MVYIARWSLYTGGLGSRFDVYLKVLIHLPADVIFMVKPNVLSCWHIIVYNKTAGGSLRMATYTVLGILNCCRIFDLSNVWI